MKNKTKTEESFMKDLRKKKKPAVKTLCGTLCEGAGQSALFYGLKMQFFPQINL